MFKTAFLLISEFKRWQENYKKSTYNLKDYKNYFSYDTLL